MNKQVGEEIPVGERIQYEGHTYEVVEDLGCESCAFKTKTCAPWAVFGPCTILSRTDRKSVCFKLIK